MGTTSRRRFLSTAAATAAAATAACTGGSTTQQASTNASAGPAAGGAPPCEEASRPPVDQAVAASFLRTPRFFDPALDTKPSSIVLMYGLVCVDFGVDKELLFPNTQGLAASDVHPHEARLWLKQSDVDAGSAPQDGVVTINALKYVFWNLSGQVMKLEGLNNGGNPVPSPSPALAWRNSPLHPWNDSQYVRCLGTLTGLTMIPTASRVPPLINARMTMGNGTVTAIPPFTERGQNGEWKVTKAVGGDTLSATTDAMVWQREYPPAVNKFRITLTPMVGSGNKVINVKQTSAPMAAVVTHAMLGGSPDLDNLKDTRAFAQLLTGGNVATHPTPKIHKNKLPNGSSGMSGSDGHCECSCN